MADIPPEGAAHRPDDSDEGMPRWVKVFALVFAVLVAVFVVVHLAGGGFRHH